MNVEGTFPKHLEERGLMDKDVLPEFPYRDDGLLVYEAIKTYVSKIIKYYYGKIFRLILSISSLMDAFLHPMKLNFFH